MFNVMVKWNHTETLHFFVVNGERGLGALGLCPSFHSQCWTIQSNDRGKLLMTGSLHQYSSEKRIMNPHCSQSDCRPPYFFKYFVQP